MRWLPLILIAAMLSGCTDEGPADQPDVAPTEIIEAPQWQLRQWWTFQNVDANGNRSTVTAVVTGEQGSDWILDTNDPNQALYDARTDVSYLGPVSKDTLAGSQGNDRVRFFDFPLELGKTWSTRWEGQDMQMEVVALASGRAEIEARAGGDVAVAYAYETEAGFFTEVEYRNDGAMAFRMDLSDSGTDYTGDVYRYTIGDALTVEGQAGAPVEQPFTLGEAVTELAIDVILSCETAGDAIVALQQPDNGQEDPFRAWQPVAQPEYQLQSRCPATVEDSEVLDVIPGPWRLDARITATAGSFTAVLEPRTLEVIPVA